MAGFLYITSPEAQRAALETGLDEAAEDEPRAVEPSPTFAAAPTLGRRAGPSERDAYLERLLKLIPAEVVSLYPVGHSLLDQTDETQQGVWTFLCLVVCVLFRLRVTETPDGHPQWVAVGISAVSFTIWAYVLGASLFWLHVPSGWNKWPSLALLLWVTVVPLIWRGAPPHERTRRTNDAKLRLKNRPTRKPLIEDASLSVSDLTIERAIAEHLGPHYGPRFSTTPLVVQAIDFFRYVYKTGTPLRKPPSISDLLHWLASMQELGADPEIELKAQPDFACRTIFVLAKTDEDNRRIHDAFVQWLESH